MTADHRLASVPVEGGELAVGEWGPPSGPSVVLVHGITSTHLSLAAVARELGEFHVLAPDLRGRGRSRGLPGPYGMARHAADVAALVESVGGPVVVAGHSMGAFVAAELARTRPQLVAGLVLIDGGLPLVPPPGVTVEDAVSATLGPAVQRLRLTFASPATYLDFWRPHPALSADWNSDVEAYLRYDLIGTEPELHSSVVPDVVPQDSAELFHRPPDDDVLAGYDGPARLLWVDRGLMGAEPGLYPPEQQAYWRERLAGRVAIETVPDLNHYTLVLRPDGAARVAAGIRSVAPA